MNTLANIPTALPSSAHLIRSTKQSSMLSRDNLVSATSWMLSGWAGFVFLSSLPYKFSNHPTTQHIFATIGGWISDTVSVPLGITFSGYGAAGIGSVELITAVVLLSPLGFWLLSLAIRRPVGPSRSAVHAVGGFLTAALMSGAVFFHLFTPLGVQVLVDGVSDGGSLFRTAFSVLVAGLALVALNGRALFNR